MRRFTGSIILFLLLATGLKAQIYSPVEWSFQSKKTGTNEYELIATATIDKGWHLYSTRTYKEDIAPLPTTFTFEPNKAYELVGRVVERGEIHEIMDPMFELEVSYYSDKVSFVQKVKLLAPISKITGSLNFMTCDDEKCLPPGDVDFNHKVSYEKASGDKQIAPDTKDKDASGDAREKKEDQASAGVDKANESSSGFTFTEAAPGSIKGAALHAPVKWKYEVKRIAKGEYDLVFTAEIEEGWHTYGLEVPEEGPVATSFQFDTIKNVTYSGKVEAVIKPVVDYDPVFEAEIAEYEEQAVFKQTVKLRGKVEKITGTLEYMACDATRCLPPEQVEFSFAIPQETISATDEPLWGVFGKGFLGGMLALFTPCVFPMIPLTVSFFLKGKKNKLKAVMSALLFGFSIIFIYVGLGLLITMLFGADALNSMASNVYFNLTFFVVFMIFAFSFLGAFEITLPSSWTTKADKNSEKGGLIGTFFIAFTLALVSFSCTGPIIGSLLVIAAESGGFVGPVSGMAGFAVALALPFTLFAIFPSWMQSLPKSGGWLNAVKVTLGFIELALALKFLSAVDLAYHWDILKREYFLALWIIIFALLGLYLLGKLRFSHDSPVQHISVPRLMLAIIAFAFTLYMVPGLWGAPVKLLSGLAPPLQYNEGFIQGFGSSPATHNAESRNVKYKSLFHSPHGLHAYYDYEEGLAAAQKANKPLMVDFTGHSCVNCRKMEENVWSDPAVLERLKNDYILVSLYVDDKTELPEDEVYISDFSGKEINTLGRKWSDLQAKEYGTNSQPYYILLDHNEKLLTEPSAYDPSISSYIEFLDKGMEEFKRRNNLAQIK